MSGMFLDPYIFMHSISGGNSLFITFITNTYLINNFLYPSSVLL